jgi:hypothetical protein
VVHINSDASLGNGGAVDLTATLKLEGDWNTSRMVNLNSGSTTIPMTIDTNGHNATLNGPVTGYTTTLTQATAGTLVKAGAGSLTITGDTNTFVQSISVNGGSLIINGTIPAHLTNAITVNTGATLGGDGVIYRNVNIASGGTLAPGNSPGHLTLFGNASLASGSVFAAELSGSVLGTGYDALSVNGTVSLDGAILNATLGYNPLGMDRLFIVINDGSDAVTGTFAGLPDMTAFTLTSGPNSYEAVISYFGDSMTGSMTGGNDIVIQIPSPGAASLLALGGLLGFRRRRA